GEADGGGVPRGTGGGEGPRDGAGDGRRGLRPLRPRRRRADLLLVSGDDGAGARGGGAEARRAAAAVAAFGPVFPDSAAEPPGRRADDVYGGAQPGGQVERFAAGSRGGVCQVFAALPRPALRTPTARAAKAWHPLHPDARGRKGRRS